MFAFIARLWRIDDIDAFSNAAARGDTNEMYSLVYKHPEWITLGYVRWNWYDDHIQYLTGPCKDY
jgi:hypothetical protein